MITVLMLKPIHVLKKETSKTAKSTRESFLVLTPLT